MKNEDRVFVSTSCIPGKTTYLNAFEYIAESNIQNIEISGNHIYDDNENLINLINSFKKKGFNFIFHNYFPIPSKEIVMNFLSNNQDIKNQSFNIIENAINIAKKTNTYLYTFHPGYFRDAIIDKSNFFKFFGPKINDLKCLDFFKNNFYNYYNDLNISQEKEISIGLENLFPNSDGSNDSAMCKLDNIIDIFNVEFIKKSKLGLLLDLGHLNIAANIFNFNKYNFLDKVIDLYGDKIYEVHLSENDGLKDQHGRIFNDSWQLKVLYMFNKTGTTKQPTVFTLESRNLDKEQIKFDFDLITRKIF